ncbi:MAG: tryptophan 7-halogenase [Sphingomonadales bacterium]|jgi:hypothetical protein|nr:tryptophan 7-halogenase [Sphingomonadales bacterium]MBK9003393.1 tryptophan 7-halogenase [Sphingomonadales bacterium]MBK9268619.1 tryptophan 7-halogenase [Sphingomonadales bacterium]MBP6434703.1 tryptophan 7-halogenase [Sphingorhabdus sp.]
MSSDRIRHVVIIGGGTAGWMTATALSRTMGGQISITLVESDEIGTIGVGEATIPAIRLFNQLIDLDEDEFIRATQGTFKLGIQFQNWGRLGDSYMYAWNHNVIAVGLASGCLEPLESTSIHLIQDGIAKLLSHFPNAGFDPVNVEAYNRRMRFDYERIRDFIIPHYHANKRTVSAFWTRCREMAIPGSLKDKLDLLRATGGLFRESEELFVVQVLTGQNITPASYHPLADKLTGEQLSGFFEDIGRIIDATARQLPMHADFIAQNCAAGVEL